MARRSPRAFIATLIGVGGRANVIFLPIANRLKGVSKQEVELRMLTLDGILAVQAGDNPRVVARPLNSYVAPTERGSEDDQPDIHFTPMLQEERKSGRPPDSGQAGSAAGARRPRERGALAAHLRGHDHAADGAVHGAVLDLVREHLEVQPCRRPLKAAFSGSVLPGGSWLDQTGNWPSSAQAPATSAEPEAIVPTTPTLGTNGAANAGQKAALAARASRTTSRS